MNEADVLRLLRQACKEAGSQRRFAERHGMTDVYVSDVLRRKRRPAGKILKALGLHELPTQYAPIKGSGR